MSVPKSRESERENCNGNISHKRRHNTHTVSGKQEANTIRALEFAVRQPNPHYARKREKTWQSFWSLVMLLPLLLLVSPHFHFQKWMRKLYDEQIKQDADIAANLHGNFSQKGERNCILLVLLFCCWCCCFFCVRFLP